MRRSLLVLAVAAGLVLVLGRWVSVIFADWEWFASLGALPVYRSQLVHQAAWRAGAGMAAFIFAFLNLYALRRSIISLVLPRRLGNLEIGEAVPGRMLLAFVAGASLILGVLLSAPPGDWTTFALARIAGLFREMDPYLDRDLSFALTWLPFERDVYEWAGRTLVTVSALTIVLYALTPSLRLRRTGVYVSAYCRRHFATLAALGLLMLAWRYRLDSLTMTSLTGDTTRPFGAFEFRIGVSLVAWLGALTALSGFVVLWTGWRGYTRIAAIAGLVGTIGMPIVEFSTRALYDSTLSASEERELDGTYASTRRLFTRRAFGADEVVTVSPATSPATSRALALRDIAIGLPAWDPAALLRADAPGQRTAMTAGIAWRAASPGIIAVAVSASWGAEGAWTANAYDAASSDERGAAVAALPDGTARHVGGWPEPLIHDGATNGIVVADSVGQIAAPAFESEVQRVLHSWNLRAPRLFATAVPSMRPRILFRRGVRERVQALVPFLTVGPSIVPLIRDDSLYWVAELFTTARAHPLSDRLMFAGELRAYVHHAATALVHAATGRVTFIANATPDAIMRTWIRRFPWLFSQASDIAAAVLAVRPPAYDWHAIQAVALARTGVDGSAGTRAAIGTDNADADLIDATPAPFAVGGATGPLGVSVPMVDASGAVIGVVVTLGGASPRTEWTPATRGERWNDLLDKLQRTADSAGIGRQRRQARRGRVLTIPVGRELLYAQAHYEWATDAAPTLAGVATIVAGAAGAGATTAAALGVSSRDPSGRDASFRAAVAPLHRQMDDAMRRGDWGAFGVAFRALGALLRTSGR